MVDQVWQSGETMDKCQYDGDAKGNRLAVENVMAHDLSMPANLDEVYAYDGLNCLADEIASITESDAESTPAPDMPVTYKYDVSSNWIGRKDTTYASDGVTVATSATQRDVFDGTNMVLAFDGNGNLTDRYLWGPAVDQLLADEQFSPSGSNQLPSAAGNTLWALSDNQNSVRDLVNDSGVLQQHIAYSPFGQQVAAQSSNPGNVTFAFGYTGTYTDSGTGFQLHGVRWYDSSVGRWLSEDPAAADENLYRYCENAPVVYVDPSGCITERKSLGPTLNAGTFYLPVDRASNAIRTDYTFSNWFTTDLEYMIQRVHDEGTFSFSAGDAGGTVTWNENYDEGWVRGKNLGQTYSFTDQHATGPHKPAEAMQKFFGESFSKGPNNTMFIGGHKVCSWHFEMTAKFEMRNASRNDWVPLAEGTNPAEFGGEGNHTWKVEISAFVIGGGGGVVTLGSNEGNKPLYGFADMLYRKRGVAPPVGQWKFGTYHVVCNEHWTESWNTSQARSTKAHTGDYV